MDPRTDDVAVEHFMDWLRDAHAMEQQAETMLTSMARRLENYPDLKLRIEQHLEETRQQARLLATCIERRGGDTSSLKDLVGKAVAMGQGLSGMFATDEVVKGAMFSYAFEHLEIAAYRNLIGAARTVGDTETQQVCERILAEEEAMADWLERHQDSIAARYLELSRVPGAQAKR
ncbi:MAG: ferritin-like domain-containing protein [Pigmentiphaga sp.]|uniref:ferritin-like domain-containing protein n=1 Tax=Pigmentiphaga sp. TaxID=1977564 RepID=UPI0029AFDD3F|nr:ferritin-like domain-containing protein [Pigmentiphaga sp.]MDX3905001.1 ferritin-like domain-containing protein [Pigmentiphaga sp.]